MRKKTTIIKNHLHDEFMLRKNKYLELRELYWTYKYNKFPCLTEKFLSNFMSLLLKNY